MKTIKIAGKEYKIIDSEGEITLAQYSQLRMILTRKEKVKKYIEAGKVGERVGHKIEVELEYDEQTEDFKANKNREVVALLSNIPTDLLENYPQIADILIEKLDFGKILKKDKKVHKELIYGTDRFLFKPINKAEFQRWSDVSRYIKQFGVWTTILIYFDRFNKKRSKYNRFFPNFDMKSRLIGSLLYKEWGATVDYILNEINNIKDSFYYVYKCSDWGDTPSKERAELSEVFGWETSIANLAESGVFGTLNDVRSSNTLEVLEYINLQTAKSRTEWLEIQRTKVKNKAKNGK